jgi:hypothetical protein
MIALDARRSTLHPEVLRRDVVGVQSVAGHRDIDRRALHCVGYGLRRRHSSCRQHRRQHRHQHCSQCCRTHRHR